MYKKLLISCVLSLFILVSAQTAAAATVNYDNNTASFQQTDWVKECKLPKFNTALGPLTSAKVTVRGEVQSYLNYENNNNVQRSVNLNIGAKLTYTKLDGAGSAAVATASFSNPSVAPRDGVIDYAGASGFKMGPKTGSGSDVITYSTPSILSAITGSGDFTISVAANDFMSGDGTANADIVTRSDAKYGCSVEYTYTAPTPTPTNVPYVCNDAKPTCKPDLFQVDAGANFAKLYINPCRENCPKIQIFYGRTESADEYSAEMNPPTTGGVFTYTINSLAPDTKYYFKIKCMNGCGTGDAGDVLSATTSSCITSYYRVGAPQKGACGTGGSDTIAAATTPGSVQGAVTTVTPKPSGTVLGATSKGSVLAAAGSPYMWMTAVIGSALIAFVATLKTTSFSAGFKSKRKRE